MKPQLEVEHEYIIIRSISMANWLVRCGFDIVKVSDSDKDDRFKVFLFRDSENLRISMSKFHQ